MDNIKELIQYVNMREQTRADLEYKVRKISNFIIKHSESVLGTDDDEARKIVYSIKELLKRLDHSHDFLENELSTNLGRLFVQKVLFVVSRIQEYVADLTSSDINPGKRRLVTWATSKYCEILTHYATRIQTV